MPDWMLSADHRHRHSRPVGKLFLDGLAGRAGRRSGSESRNCFCHRGSPAWTIPRSLRARADHDVYAPLVFSGAVQMGFTSISRVAGRFQNREAVAGNFSSAPVGTIVAEKEPSKVRANAPSFRSQLGITTALK